MRWIRKKSIYCIQSDRKTNCMKSYSNYPPAKGQNHKFESRFVLNCLLTKGDSNHCSSNVTSTLCVTVDREYKYILAHCYGNYYGYSKDFCRKISISEQNSHIWNTQTFPSSWKLRLVVIPLDIFIRTASFFRSAEIMSATRTVSGSCAVHFALIAAISAPPESLPVVFGFWTLLLFWRWHNEKSYEIYGFAVVESGKLCQLFLQKLMPLGTV